MPDLGLWLFDRFKRAGWLQTWPKRPPAEIVDFTMSLRISNLHKTYRGGVRALDNLSLKIEPGLFGLLGPNGSGKSTLMRILATLLEADSGEIVLDDIDLLRNPNQVRPLLGYLPQSFGAYPNMTAFEMLDYVATMKGLAPASHRRRCVDRLLAMVHLFEQRHRRADQFSGGMVRRLGIAQAMLGDPKLLIVDEPTAGLDPLERQSLYGYLSEISKSTIVILATHLVDDVRSLCRELAILGAGRILSQGHPEKIIESIQGRVWTKSVTPDEIEEIRKSFAVIGTRWNQQHLFVDVVQEESPRGDFQVKTVNLQDAYFAISQCSSALSEPVMAQ